jgi:hypothetical protein
MSGGAELTLKYLLKSQLPNLALSPFSRSARVRSYVGIVSHTQGAEADIEGDGLVQAQKWGI